MAKCIMIQGTTSNAGKTLITAGLCRIFAQDGFKVAPFKSQNLALNSYITEDGLEMGRAQVVQAEAAMVSPDVRMNPILLKPTTGRGAQVVLNGEVLDNMDSNEYLKNKVKLMGEIKKAYNSLSNEFDIIVIEGAGSPAEINLKESDIVNMGLAKEVNAPVLLVGDIDRGGVFAALYGTILLLDEDEQAHIKGLIINKFRGELSMLQSGLEMFTEKTQKEFLGVVPFFEVDIDDEDVISERFSKKSIGNFIDIVVIKTPMISNFTDFNCFERIKGVSVRYVSSKSEIKNPDMIILAGTKSTIADLLWIRENGFEEEIIKFAKTNKPIFGICGGFQMLCKTITDKNNVEFLGEVCGIGLLPYKTEFLLQKVRTNKSGILANVSGIFTEISGLDFKGYEIHMGITDVKNNLVNEKNVYGTYIHGIFDQNEIAQNILKAIAKMKNIDSSFIEKNKTLSAKEYKESQYNLLAEHLRESLNMEKIYKILNDGI